MYLSAKRIFVESRERSWVVKSSVCVCELTAQWIQINFVSHGLVYFGDVAGSIPAVVFRIITYVVLVLAFN